MLTQEQVTVIVPQHEEVKTKTKCFCDLCGVEAIVYDEHSGLAYWSTGYDVEETRIQLKEGTVYPEGGSGTYTRLHICPPCFKSELLLFMEARCKTGNFQVTETEWEV